MYRMDPRQIRPRHRALETDSSVPWWLVPGADIGGVVRTGGCCRRCFAVGVKLVSDVEQPAQRMCKNTKACVRRMSVDHSFHGPSEVDDG